MTHTMTRATLSERYKAIRQRLGDQRTPPRPIIPIDRIRPEPPAPAPEPLSPAPIMTRPAVIRRPAHEPVIIPPPKPNARRYVFILHDVATRHNISVEELVSASRKHALCIARHEAYYLLRQAGYSWPQCAQFCGGRDHTTAIHGAQRHEARLKEGK